ncbi:MAG TPA: tetratricopeptide repeat protein, partial [archaeon]|nr:tetratricopeptide repeat protein [archaeon]
FLGSLAQADYPRNTVILLRAAYLFERGLFTETRAELQAALAADPDAPSLHVMLGRVYERTGLPDLALSEFDEAQFLSAGGH